jgi:hypothetical protein
VLAPVTLAEREKKVRYIIFYSGGSVYATTEWIEVAETEAKRIGGSYLQVTDLNEVTF